MKNIINNHLKKIDKQEQKILNKKEKNKLQEKISPLVEKVESKVPEALKETLKLTFYKAFQLVFEKGTKYIEKMYNKEKIQLDHNIKDFLINQKVNRKSIRAMDKHSKKSNVINASISTIEGAGLGLVGMGLPDIPLFTAMILKTIYEIALSYGFVYELHDEKIYVLQLIRGALTKGNIQSNHNALVEETAKYIDNHIQLDFDLNKEIEKTSEVLSEAMLTSKFVQGIPVVGVVGSITNFVVIKKISKYSTIKYKKRYLNKKM